jgi:hypothetical protein
MVTSQKPTAPAASPDVSPHPSAAHAAPPAAAAFPIPSSRQPPAPTPDPSEEEIRDYANHLYVQRGSVDGHDWDDWLEAKACLGANIPKESCRTRVHHHTQITERAALPLVKHGRS